MYKHAIFDTTFTLVVDNFGIKYTSKKNALHLLNYLRQLYILTTDWKGELYVELTLRWDYVNRIVDLSMPGYVERALQQFCPPARSKPHHSHYQWNPPTYGAKLQIASVLETSNLLDEGGIKRLQKCVDLLLHHTRAVNSPVLPALNTIDSEQASGTESTSDAAT